ncbi:hypothetical protein DFH09DRAFT_1325369 [Mycena vulgaris]|nr:hypothetical protein DFH09DRAFT_1325369 [Mycena vulgaris]
MARLMHRRLGLRSDDARLLLRRHPRLRLVNKYAWFRARAAVPRPVFPFPLLRATLMSSFASLLSSSKKPNPGPGLVNKLTDVFRYTSTCQFHLRAANWYAPPLAAIIGVAGFIMALMLAVRQFYWPSAEMGHSPPIVTRAGWISIAIMPFMMYVCHVLRLSNPLSALVGGRVAATGAGKIARFGTQRVRDQINFVGLLTNMSHEKLQVFHRWSATFMYITSLVHTYPFIINNIKMGDMMASYATSPWQRWCRRFTDLIVLSWVVFRNPHYETFKKLHFIASGIFMATLFIHVNLRLTSWDYFWATAAIYGLAWLSRVVRTLYITGFGLLATVESVGPALIKISIRVPARFKWAPGQHVFVRLIGLGAHALTSHPFTLSSLPVVSAGADNTAELMLRADWATRAVVDGPYCGLHIPLKAYKRVYFLAGGTGATFVLPILVDLVVTIKVGGAACRRVELVTTVPDSDSYSWMESSVAAAAARLPDGVVGVRAHFTRAEGTKDSQTSVDILSGRPVLGDIVREAHTSAGKVAIVACGPHSFLYDVRNAVAQAQLVNADGFGECKDLFLHTETYRCVDVYLSPHWC